ncbi:MAG: glycogen/starch/alpha-glucan phosphorylase [Ethanoligenens sp.]|uniref:glycogen/starch/alpha-glucan phosphorylase n=1 Tax=Ethanoligenens sp. TaxID=2099655 RepID=UPI0039ECF2F2
MRLPYSKAQAKANIQSKLECHFGVTPSRATPEQMYNAVAMAVQDILSAQRREWTEKRRRSKGKTAYYLCMEFLMGRSLKNHLFNLNATSIFTDCVKDMGFNLTDLYELEPDAGLGNGGLGRLAACFLDAAAGLRYPLYGYSIRYDYGIFRQKIVDGWQTELPDFWLPGGEVWLTPRPDEAVTVEFDGEIKDEWNGSHHSVSVTGQHVVTALPYDMMVSGYKSGAVGVLRLWSARSPSFDIGLFNQGDYMHAIEESSMAEVISKVLYPSDNHIEGKSLRLRQQYFLVSASMQDIIRKHIARYGTLANLAEKIAIHINETHPALSIPELMRILLDDHGYGWDDAWAVVTKIVAYTNHTVMHEALEVWPEELFSRMLPRIYQIVHEINERLCKHLWIYYPNDWKKISYMAVIAYGQIRMANLCIACCHSVNGVSTIHSNIIKTSLFADYARTFPEKFTNVTNGIAHRRWLAQSNPELSSLLQELIGNGFLTDAAQLTKLRAYADDPAVLDRLEKIKRNNKARMSDYVKQTTGIILDPDSIFDVQVKRLHEYKRQLMNALHILHLYDLLKANPQLDIPPQTFLFAAKAAPGYLMAKQIIRLICSIAKEIDSDPVISKKLKVVFLEDYRVTLAELLMPSAEISEQISLAGTEASGTGNMKLMINGAVTLGTLDGSNVEMLEAVGENNILIFGLHADEVEALRTKGYSPTAYYHNNPDLRAALDRLSGGIGGIRHPEISDSLIGKGSGQADPYMVLADFASYCTIHEEALARYADRKKWNRMSLINIASAGGFSADRALREYAKNIWDLETVD